MEEAEMRTGRPKQALILTDEERDRLQSLAHRARSQPLLARRARLVLACAEGLDNKTVARKMRASLGMVGKWRSRFLKARLADQILASIARYAQRTTAARAFNLWHEPLGQETRLLCCSPSPLRTALTVPVV